MTQSVKEDRQFRLSSRRLRKELLEVFHEIRGRAEKLRDLRVDVQEGYRVSLVFLQDCQEGLVDFWLCGESFLKRGLIPRIVLIVVGCHTLTLST
jgi:hypothetical protein